MKSSLFEDLYMSVEWISDSAVLLHANVVPMMSFLWTGLVMLMIGIVVRSITFRQAASS